MFKPRLDRKSRMTCVKFGKKNVFYLRHKMGPKYSDNFASKSRVSHENSLQLGLRLHGRLSKKFPGYIRGSRSGDCVLGCDAV
jgi:hypothetical protein